MKCRLCGIELSFGDWLDDKYFVGGGGGARAVNDVG